jgi:hypothetical protein
VGIEKPATAKSMRPPADYCNSLEAANIDQRHDALVANALKIWNFDPRAPKMTVPAAKGRWRTKHAKRRLQVDRSKS